MNTNFGIWVQEEFMMATLLSYLIVSEEFRNKFRDGLLWDCKNDFKNKEEECSALRRKFIKWLKQEPDPHGLVSVPIKTNFDRITASPEALAEWLNEHSDYCREIQNWQCDKCPYGDKDCTIENTWLDWLNEEKKDD